MSEITIAVINEKFPEIASMFKDDKFISLKADWNKMLEYYKKYSNPSKIASSIKDIKKLLSRYIISKIMKWTDVSDKLYHRFDWFKYHDFLIFMNKEMLKTVDIPKNFLNEVEKIRNKYNGSNFDRVFNYEKIKTVLLKSKVLFIVNLRNGTKTECYRMSQNGRCWTLAYSIIFNNDLKFDFACDTNEGIDCPPYGYSIDGSYAEYSQSDVAEALEKFMVKNNLV